MSRRERAAQGTKALIWTGGQKPTDEACFAPLLDPGKFNIDDHITQKLQLWYTEICFLTKHNYFAEVVNVPYESPTVLREYLKRVINQFFIGMILCFQLNLLAFVAIESVMLAKGFWFISET